MLSAINKCQDVSYKHTVYLMHCDVYSATDRFEVRPPTRRLPGVGVDDAKRWWLLHRQHRLLGNPITGRYEAENPWLSLQRIDPRDWCGRLDRHIASPHHRPAVSPNTPTVLSWSLQCKCVDGFRKSRQPSSLCCSGSHSKVDRFFRSGTSSPLRGSGYRRATGCVGTRAERLSVCGVEGSRDSPVARWRNAQPHLHYITPAAVCYTPHFTASTERRYNEPNSPCSLGHTKGAGLYSRELFSTFCDPCGTVHDRPWDYRPLPRSRVGYRFDFSDTGAKTILLKRYRFLNGAWTDIFF